MNAAEIFSQVARLLETHPFVGAQTQALMAVLDSCAFSIRPPGHVLCEEGAVGQELYFVLDGAITVLRGGRELVTISAPALLGHMSVIDGTPRSARCVVAASAYIGTLSLDDHRYFLDDVGVSGTAYRRLLLSSLNQQLLRGNERCLQIISGTDEQEHIEAALGALEGWRR